MKPPRTRRLTRVLAAAASLGTAALMFGAAAPANAQEIVGPLHNFLNNSYCLGIAGGGGPGSKAVLWLCNGHKDQQWMLGAEHVSGTSYEWQLKNEDGWCLGVAGASRTEGADLVAWNCESYAKDSNEYWEPQLNQNGSLAFANYVDVFNQVIGVAGSVMAEGQPIVQWPYQPGPGDLNQFWSLLSTT